MVVIGQERPETIADIDGPTTIDALDEDGSLIEAELPEAAEAIVVPRAMFADALLAYQSGETIEALGFARSAAKGGDMRAQMLAGLILARGEAGVSDDAEARRYLEMAAGQGDVDALLLLGEMAVDGRAGMGEADAQRWFRKAAELGSTQAMRAMSTLNAGSGASAAWENKAAKAGDTEAMRRRAVALQDSDPVAAMEWFEKAAAKGDAEAAYAGAILQLENYDLPPDEARAARLMRVAAEGGVAAGMADWGLLLYQGAGVERDVPASAGWFEKAAKAGDPEGMFLWAFTLAKGEGVPVDYEEAYYWLLKSGSSDVPEYATSRQQLRERLEANVDAAVLERARARQ